MGFTLPYAGFETCFGGTALGPVTQGFETCFGKPF